MPGMMDTVLNLGLNDQTVEGLRFDRFRGFSVQYHPEACPGPHDSRYLFDQFVRLMDGGELDQPSVPDPSAAPVEATPDA